MKGWKYMKRKIYDELTKWKQESNGEVAILIDGARRIGKSYIAEQFAKENYKTYIFIKNFRYNENAILCSTLRVNDYWSK